MNPSQKTNGRVSGENVCHVLSGVFPIELSSFVKGVLICSSPLHAHSCEFIHMISSCCEETVTSGLYSIWMKCFAVSTFIMKKLLHRICIVYEGGCYEKDLLQ